MYVPRYNKFTYFSLVISNFPAPLTITLSNEAARFGFCAGSNITMDFNEKGSIPGTSNSGIPLIKRGLKASTEFITHADTLGSLL